MSTTLSSFLWVVVLSVALSSFFNAFFVFQQLMIQKDIENLSAKLVEADQIQQRTQSLINQTVTYAQKDPSILPALLKHGIATQVQQPSNP